MKQGRSDGSARREALLDAALACFEQHGLVRTGIEEIRKAAGASPSSVYHLFEGLPEIIAALLERTFVQRYREVTVKVVSTKTARSAVFALVEAHLAWVFAHPVEARFMYRALALDLDGSHRQELRAMKEELKTELVRHLRALGVLAEVGVPETMIDVVLLGATHQACRNFLATSGSSLDPKWMKKTLPELAWRSVRAVENSAPSARTNKRSMPHRAQPKRA